MPTWTSPPQLVALAAFYDALLAVLGDGSPGTARTADHSGSTGIEGGAREENAPCP